jgi:hypothetical protein
VDAERLVLAYEVTFVPTVAICAHGIVDVLRSILNPVSLVDVSTQVRLIWLEETVDAERLEGGVGGEEPACVVAEAVFE